MNKFLTLNFILLIFISCTSSMINQGKRSWSKKPMFASVMIDDVQYTLTSENNQYSIDGPTSFLLTLKNLTESKKDFETTDDKFLICTILAEHKNRTKLIINSSDVIKNRSFSLLPLEERSFDFSIMLDKEIILKNEYLYTQMNLYFLKKQFRRNSLTLYLERK
ncbi:MAG: hypothetical protein JXR69_04120 [Candidatus Delongbacteria bacterium]|nr:hypothetical protein [Candidatus Delongbacteria bacterium]